MVRLMADLGDTPNIEFIFGDSREALKSIVAGIPGSAIFWLDAHWMGADTTFGKNNGCPVLEEIEAVNASSHDHYIFIDDARLFLSPPPHPLSIGEWPGVDTVFRKLNEHGRYVVLFSDTTIAVPRSAEAFTTLYCQNKSTDELTRDSRKKGGSAYRATRFLNRGAHRCGVSVKKC